MAVMNTPLHLPEDDVFRPSEYTAALLRQIRLSAPCPGRALEIGTGSGVVLAALSEAGPSRLVGVDIEPDAVRRTRALLQSLDIGGAAVHCGDLWAPLAGEVFDLVVFNPPQLPVQDDMADGHRLRTWSDGGSDGREVLDRFLAGLAEHLAAAGRAFITHSAFVGLADTRRLLGERSLRAEVTQTVCAPIPAWKLRLLPPRWLDHHLGRSLHSIGPYVFCDFHILEIRHANAFAAA